MREETAETEMEEPTEWYDYIGVGDFLKVVLKEASLYNFISIYKFHFFKEKYFKYGRE